MKNKLQPDRQPNIEDQLYSVGLGLLLAAPLILAMYQYLRTKLPFLAMPCLLRTFTGYYCPGCGGTRAVYALLHLQLWRSFCYHPFVPYTAAVYGWFMISHTIEKISHRKFCIGMKWNPAWLWMGLAILMINVLIKDGAIFFFHVDLLRLAG